MTLNIQIAVDCRNPHELADWWAETLEWAVELQDESFIRSMIAQGFATEAETTTHHGKLVWDAPLDWIRGREQWNRVLFLQFPDAPAAGAWLRDPATLTARALASRDLGDLLVLVAVPEA